MEKISRKDVKSGGAGVGGGMRVGSRDVWGRLVGDGKVVGAGMEEKEKEVLKKGTSGRKR